MDKSQVRLFQLKEFPGVKIATRANGEMLIKFKNMDYMELTEWQKLFIALYNMTGMFIKQIEDSKQTAKKVEVGDARL
jgi:hypothetical protein